MSSRSARFAVLLLWNSAAFVVALVSAFVINPLVVRGLGIEAYGVWALVFSLLDYLNIADLGIRSATVKYVAHYSTLNDQDQLYKTLNASLLYFLSIAAILASVIFLFARISVAFFHIPPVLTEDYVLLLRLTGITIAFQLLFNVPKAALEGIQEFPAISRINICVSTIRATLSLLALHFHLGLAGLGWATVIATWCGFVILIWVFRRHFPDFSVAPHDFDRAMFRQLFRYGVPSLVGSVAGQFLYSGPVVLLGILKDAASVGYYSLVLRLLAGLYELLSQAAGITTSAMARLAAEDAQTAMRRAVLYLNRYAFALFHFVFVFLLLFGDSLFTLWVGPTVAAQCRPIIPWLAFGYAYGYAAHQNSIGTLFGLAAHQWFSYGLLIESAILLGGWFFFIPSQPLWFAAAWWGISLFLSRGLRPTWHVARTLHISFAGLLGGIYIRPLVASALTATLGIVLLRTMPPSDWYSLLAIAATLGLFHLACCFVLVLAPDHRQLILNFRAALRGAA
ncbi:MAG: oligosaccharide flippase family protein [Bryobacteraceae bacterium]